MTLVHSGHKFVVSAVTESGLVVLKGGTVIVLGDADTSGAELDGGNEYVSSGSEAIATTAGRGGSLVVGPGLRLRILIWCETD